MLKSYYLKESKHGRKFLSTTVGVRFEEGVIDELRKATKQDT